MSRLAVLLLTLGACATGSTDDGDSIDPRKIATDLAYSHTYAVTFTEDGKTIGYVVEFYRVPQGIIDRRSSPPGTVLVQDLDLENIGFITPGGRAFRYDARGGAHDMGFAGRDQHVASFFGQSGRPHYTATHPAPPTG